MLDHTGVHGTEGRLSRALCICRGLCESLHRVPFPWQALPSPCSPHNEGYLYQGKDLGLRQLPWLPSRVLSLSSLSHPDPPPLPPTPRPRYDHKGRQIAFNQRALCSSSLPERDWGTARPGSLFPTPVPRLPPEKHVQPDSRRASAPDPPIVPCVGKAAGARETQTAPCQPPPQRSLAMEFKALIVICF